MRRLAARAARLALALGGALVAGLTWSSRRSWLKRTCESSLLRWFGRYSYAGYVIHFPLMYLLLDRWKRVLGVTPLSLAGVPGRILFTLVSLAVSSGLAYLSWYAIERPFLRLRRFFDAASPTPAHACANEQPVPRPIPPRLAFRLPRLGQRAIPQAPERAADQGRHPE
jgi:peptidoglycan/LPS O-acetylase OafA/YrhL